MCVFELQNKKNYSIPNVHFKFKNIALTTVLHQPNLLIR